MVTLSDQWAIRANKLTVSTTDAGKHINMDCSHARELLSAFHDDEHSLDERAAVAEHLAGCHDCTRELQRFRSLSAVAKGLVHPEPPTDMWRQLEEQLDAGQASRSQRTTIPYRAAWTRKPAVRLGLAVAAAVVIIVGWFGSSNWSEHDANRQVAAIFGGFLDEFQHDPHAAQQELVAKYDGQAVNAEQAVHTVGYRPAVANGMPDGYSVQTTYATRMPCCTCVHCLCKRDDGTMIAVFEHDDAPDWFGDRPESKAICNGTQCSIVDLGNRLAATWRRGKQYITVVGAKDRAEIDSLVAWFDDRQKSPPR